MNSSLDIRRIVILSALLHASNFAYMIFGSDDFETTVFVPTTFYVRKETNERNLIFPSIVYTCESE
jgi:hypothetical protein